MIEIWRRGLVENDRDPAIEVNVPMVSFRSRWPFIIWGRDPIHPWSIHVHVPGRRVLTVRTPPRTVARR